MSQEKMTAVVLDDEQSRAIDAVCNTLTPKQVVGLGDHIRALRSIQWQARAASPQATAIDPLCSRDCAVKCEYCEDMERSDSQATATQPAQMERALTGEHIEDAVNLVWNWAGLDDHAQRAECCRQLRELLTAAQAASDRSSHE